MRRRLIIGITGTLGAGKGAVVDYLVGQHAFLHFSARAFLLDAVLARHHYRHRHLQQRGRVTTPDSVAVDRAAISQVANELRAQHGPAYLAEQLLAQATAALNNNYELASSAGGDAAQPGGAIIESIRTTGEVDALRAAHPGNNFLLLALDAAPRLRYDRIVLRKSETDSVSFEAFLEDERREMDNREPHKQNLRECIRMADARLTNDGTLADLHAQVDEVLTTKLSLDQLRIDSHLI